MAHYISCGVAVIDRVWQVQALPVGAGKQRATGYLEVGGGLAANAAVAIARLGERSAFWGRVGGDPTGDLVLRQFRQEGVETGRVRRIADAKTVAAAVLVAPDGERAIVSFHDPALDPDPGFLPVRDIASAAGVLADVRWPEGGERVLAEARRLGLPSVLDVEICPPAVTETLGRLAGYTIFSEPGLQAYAGEGDIHAALDTAWRALGDVVAVTRGAAGVLVQTGAGRASQSDVPAPKVQVVDTTGAGDAFHGAYLVAITESGDPIAAARFANAVAALKCTRLGGRAGLPTRAEVEAFVAGGGARPGSARQREGSSGA
jgi:sulfofructose kinase